MNNREDVFPPRGSGTKGREESLPSATWITPDDLGSEYTWRQGRLLIGKWGDRLIGFDDDRHAFTSASARSGKTSTVLLQNLATYPGSIVVTDPKGELARRTAKRRAAMGQRVFVLDPFGELEEDGIASASYNPFSELGFGRPRHVAPDAALAADASIVPNEHDPHWTESARNLVRSFILLHIATEGQASIRKVRRMLQSANMIEVFERMMLMGDFDETLSNAGSSFLSKARDGEREFASILSTAQEQTSALDDVRHVSDTSDFNVSDLSRGGITVYAVLPGLRMATHFRWLRMIVQMALGAVERYPVPRGGQPVLFMLEEFPALGYMRPIEVAAGLLPGAGVRLWPVVQDFTQLKANYPKSWETFLSNAGTIQVFAVNDITTAEYLSKLLGMTQVMERQPVRMSTSSLGHGDPGYRDVPRATRLLEPDELMRAFARETGRQLLLTPGKPPIYLERMNHYDAP